MRENSITSMQHNSAATNIFLRMHPLHRIVIGVALAAVTFFFIPDGTSSLIEIMALWIVFALTYLTLSGIVLFNQPVPAIKKYAKKDDGSKAFVFAMVLLSSLASIFLVLLLMISKSFTSSEHGMFVFVSIAGILISWFMVHTLYTFHYAHMYYDDAEEDKTKDAKGLDFPQDDDPDYIDFAYFSFVIGCTFQVSDIEIKSRQIRHAVLAHQLISFFLNTFVVALTINLIAGLTN